MIKEWAINRNCARWSVGALVISAVIWWTACSPSAPFPSYDPPPTFAVHHTLSVRTGLYYPAAAGTGSSITGSHVVDIVGTSFVPLGGAYSFGPAWVDFGTYYVVNNGRWPARWDINAVGGCGAGTGERFDITSKIVETTCRPNISNVNVDPGAYTTSNPPDTLRLQFFGFAGSPVDVYIVDDYGTIYAANTGMTIDGSGEALFYSPPTTSGLFNVAADLYTLPNSYEAAQGNLSVY